MKLWTVLDAFLANQLAHYLKNRFSDLENVPSFTTYFTLLGVSLRTGGDHYLAAAYMLADIIHKTMVRVWQTHYSFEASSKGTQDEGPGKDVSEFLSFKQLWQKDRKKMTRYVNLVTYGLVSYLSVPMYFSNPERFHKLYRKTLDANMLPVVNRQWGKFLINNMRIALPFFLISLVMSRRNKARNKSVKKFAIAYFRNVLYLLVMGVWFYGCQALHPNGRIFLTFSGFMAISTADESQHTSLTVFTLAQILYALLKPHAGCAAPRVTSL